MTQQSTTEKERSTRKSPIRKLLDLGEDRKLDLHQSAEFLGCTYQWLCTAISENAHGLRDLRYKVGRRSVFRLGDLRVWLEARKGLSS